MGLNLRKLVLHIVGVHRLDLLPRRCAQNLDDLHQLVDPTLSREQRLTEHQFRHDTTRGPYVYTARCKYGEIRSPFNSFKREGDTLTDAR